MSLIMLAIFSSLVVVLFKFFQWSIMDIVTPFAMPFLWLMVYGFFTVVTIISSIRFFKTKQWRPVLVQLFTVLLLFFFPFNKIVLDLEFHANKSEREEVGTLIEKEVIKPNVAHNESLILLPEEYRSLSKGGGEVIVEDGSVFFFTFRGILDNFSGFVYSPADVKPRQGDFGGDFKEIVKLEKHWYFVGSF